jgi:hypothetical protein
MRVYIANKSTEDGSQKITKPSTKITYHHGREFGNLRTGIKKQFENYKDV